MTARMDLRDRWVAFCHRLPPFRGRLAAARIIGKHLLSHKGNRVAYAPLANGFRLKVDLGWAEAYESLYYFHTPYEEPLSRLLRAAVDTPSADYIDVGANIGVFCLGAADILRARGGRALAIEPIPANVHFIKDSVTANNLEDVIEIVACAAGDSDGTLQLSQMAYGNAVNAIPLRWGAGGTTNGEILRWNEPFQRPAGTLLIDVPMKTLDEIASSRGFQRTRFLKIDVEGAELFVLRGATEILRRQRPIVYAEFHQELMKANGTSLDHIASFCREMRYGLRYLTLDSQITNTRPHPEAKYLDAVLVPDDPDAHQRLVIASFTS